MNNTEAAKIIADHDKMGHEGIGCGCLDVLYVEDDTQAERIARWEANRDKAQAKYDTAKDILAYHERHGHILSIEAERGIIARINAAQDDVERAKYYLRRAKNGLPV